MQEILGSGALVDQPAVVRDPTDLNAPAGTLGGRCESDPDCDGGLKCLPPAGFASGTKYCAPACAGLREIALVRGARSAGSAPDDPRHTRRRSRRYPAPLLPPVAHIPQSCGQLEHVSLPSQRWLPQRTRAASEASEERALAESKIVRALVARGRFARGNTMRLLLPHMSRRR